MLELAPIIELLANARADFRSNLGGVDRRIHAPVDRENPLQLLQVGFDRRLHVGILQLAGQRLARMGAGAMHLAERGRRGRMMLEARDLALPVGPELRHHAPLDETPAHGGRLALQLGELGGVFGRQRIRDGGDELRHFHDRALEAAERGRKLDGALAAVEIHAEEARAGETRRHPAHIGADPRIAGGAGGKAIGFAIGHRQPYGPASRAPNEDLRLRPGN